MASLDLCPPRFCTTTPHFFKIILDVTSRHKLKIPKKFVMKYGKDLLNSVCLKLPSGSEWEVELIRCKGKIWFEKGWPEFSVFCSLEYGSFLIFRYEGHSHFHVCIFDVSATEIDYPITIPKIEDDDLSIEILEDFQPSCPKTRKKSPLPCHPYKKMKTSLSGNKGTTLEHENSKHCDMLHKSLADKDSHRRKLEEKSRQYKDKDGGSSSSFKRSLKPTHETLGRMKSSTATEKANEFKSDKPSFRIAMHPYSVHYNRVYLPNDFTKRYLMNLPAGIAILRVSDGRTWSVMLKYDHVESRALFQVVFLPSKDSASWPSSTGHGREATVRVIEKKHPPLQVEPECSMDSKIGRKKMSEFSEQVTQMPSSSLRTSSVNLEAASKFSSTNPIFKVTLGSGHTLHVPATFARSFIKHGKQTAMLQVKDRLWHVNLISYQPNATSISQGWPAFAKENCLRKGDVCIFELVEMNAIVLKCHIFRC